MTEQDKCTKCGAPLPASVRGGLCPACLLKRGLETNTVGFTDEDQAEAARRWTPPTVEQLTPIFPELDILELIGRGGMGAVYKAREKQLDRLVALKILPPEIGREEAFAQRFAREAQAMAKLSHSNIVTIHSFGSRSGTGVSPVSPPAVPAGEREEHGQDARATHGRDAHATSGKLYFFIMEYVDGLSLRQLLDAGTVSPKEALAIVPQICDALQYAHDRGIVHRDIKPENILLNRAGQVKIADFGLAKLVGSSIASGMAVPAMRSTGGTPVEETARHGQDARDIHGRDTHATHGQDVHATQQVMGTPRYMAPEQIERPREVDHRADIYSLGVVFYQMLTGELPKGRSGKEFEPPSHKVLIDVRLDEVVLRALEREPARRYQQVSEVRTQVETIVTTGPTIAPPLGSSAEGGCNPGEPLHMGSAESNAHLVARLARWVARIGGAATLVFLLVCVLTEPVPQVQENPWGRTAALLWLAGWLIGWKWEAWGAALLLGGSALYLHVKMGGEGIAQQLPFAAVGLLFALSWWLRQPKSPVLAGRSKQCLDARVGGVVLVAAILLAVLTALAIHLLTFAVTEGGTELIWGHDFRQFHLPFFWALWPAISGFVATTLLWPQIARLKTDMWVRLALLVVIAVLLVVGLPSASVAFRRQGYGFSEGLHFAYLGLCAALSLPLWTGHICRPRRIPIIGARDGRRAVHWPGLLMRLVFAAVALGVMGIAGAHWQAMAVIGLAIAGVLAVGIIRAWAVPMDQLTPLESRPDRVDSQPRMSRLAIIGAVWAGFTTLYFVLFFTGGVRAGMPGHSEVTTFGVLLGALITFLGYSAPLGTTICGTVSISQIRHSVGRLYGLGLALFDAMLFPLLILDGLIIAACYGLAITYGPVVSTPGGGTLQAVQYNMWIMAVGVVICGVLDLAIVRWAWRVARRPVGQPADHRTPPNAATQPPALSPEAAVQIDCARQAVKAPAIGMIVAATINLLIVLAAVGLFTIKYINAIKSPHTTVVKMASPTTSSYYAENGRPILEAPTSDSYYLEGGSTYSQSRAISGSVPVVSRMEFFALLIPAVVLLPTVLVLIGSIRMMQLRNRGLAITAAILALIAAPGNIIGLPMGIWALVVLSRREVADAFVTHRTTSMSVQPRSSSGKVASLVLLAINLVLLAVFALILVPNRAAYELLFKDMHVALPLVTRVVLSINPWLCYLLAGIAAVMLVAKEFIPHKTVTLILNVLGVLILGAACMLYWAAFYIPTSAMIQSISAKPTTGSNAQSAAGEWKSVLPSGVAVEMIGVSESPSDGKQWWRPDGSPLVQRPYKSFAGNIYPSKGQIGREFAVRTVPPMEPLSENNTNWAFAIQPSSEWGGYVTFLKGTNSVAAIFPEAVNHITVKYGVATGPWTTIGDFTGKEDKEFSVGEVRFTVARAVEHDKYVAVNLDYKTPEQRELDVRIVVVDKSGQTHTSETTIAGFNADRNKLTRLSKSFTFDGLKLSDIQRLEFQTRPYHWAVFNHVSLHPTTHPAESDENMLQEKLKIWVEKFFSQNYRDITARKTLEWGQPETTPGGNPSIRYKYLATIWNKDKLIIEQRFTFTPEGKYVSAETIEKGPASQPASRPAMGEEEKAVIQVAGQFVKAVMADDQKAAQSLVATVPAMNSAAEVAVVGSVPCPGIYPWPKNKTVKQLLLSAGFTVDAAKDKRFYIVRRDADKKVVEHPVEVPAILQGAANDIDLQPGDLLVAEGIRRAAETQASRPANRPVGSKLEFRVAPNPSDLDKAELTRQMERLKVGWVGLWWKKSSSDITVAIPQYAWLPIWGELTNAPQLITGEYDGQKYILVSDKPEQTMVPGQGKDAWGLTKVYATTDGMNRQAVGFELDNRGAELFSALTKSSINNTLTIVVDGKVVSAPIVGAALGKQGIITGRFTEQEINALVQALKTGMPAGQSAPATRPAP